MSQRLKGKIAVVTGAGSGIGEATARLMAREGAIVVLADRAAPAAEAVARDIAAQGGTAEAREVDVGDAAAMRQMIEAVAQRHGRLDVLVNNAGYGIAANVVDTAEDDWARLMRVNVDGVFHGCKYAIPIMRRQGGGGDREHRLRGRAGGPAGARRLLRVQGRGGGAHARDGPGPRHGGDPDQLRGARHH